MIIMAGIVIAMGVVRERMLIGIKVMKVKTTTAMGVDITMVMKVDITMVMMVKTTTVMRVDITMVMRVDITRVMKVDIITMAMKVDHQKSQLDWFIMAAEVMAWVVL